MRLCSHNWLWVECRQQGLLESNKKDFFPHGLFGLFPSLGILCVQNINRPFPSIEWDPTSPFNWSHAHYLPLFLCTTSSPKANWDPWEVRVERTTIVLLGVEKEAQKQIIEQFVGKIVNRNKKGRKELQNRLWKYSGFLGTFKGPLEAFRDLWGTFGHF